MWNVKEGKKGVYVGGISFVKDYENYVGEITWEYSWKSAEEQSSCTLCLEAITGGSMVQSCHVCDLRLHCRKRENGSEFLTLHLRKDDHALPFPLGQGKALEIKDEEPIFRRRLQLPQMIRPKYIMYWPNGLAVFAKVSL